MGRGGRDKSTETPERRCIVSGETGPTSGLIRFVVDPDGGLVPDLGAKLPGRGIWVSAQRSALEKAVAKKLFSRAAKRTVAIPARLTDMVESGLSRRVTDLLSFARKAGEAVAGYEKVRGWLQTGQAVVLLQASDGSERGKTKLRLPPEEGPTLQCLTAREIGLSFGRDHVIHAALSAGGLTTRIVEDANRLSGVRSGIGDVPPGKDDRIA